MMPWLPLGFAQPLVLLGLLSLPVLWWLLRLIPPQPRRIAFFADFLNRTGTMKAKLGGWKELFWETAHNQQGD